MSEKVNLHAGSIDEMGKRFISSGEFSRMIAD